MSRIGKKLIEIPETVSIVLENTKISVKGKYGTLDKLFLDLINIKKNNFEKNIIRHCVKKSTIQLFLLLLYYCYISIILWKGNIFN